MPEIDRRHQIYIVTGIIVSLIIMITAINIAGNRLSLYGRTSSTSTSASGVLSLENSYLFASPLSALSNGMSSIRVTAFLLDDRGLGVAGQQVTLSTSSPLAVTPVLPVTDSVGRAIFDLTSENLGTYTITAAASGVSLPQKVQISFR